MSVETEVPPGAELHVRLALARPNPPKQRLGRIGVSGRDVERHGFSLDVAFDAPAGITVLFGPSGAGKSTTLAAIAGLVRPARGRIALASHVWFDSQAGIDIAIHDRRVAFVFQSLALFPHLTGIQNVTYGMDRSLDYRARRADASALLARLHVSHVAARKPATFSGGEAQRVALARALGMKPRAILLDEPFSALDRELRAELLAEVRTVVRELNVPVILVTHHREDAAAIAARVVRLERGRVVATGSVAELGP